MAINECAAYKQSSPQQYAKTTVASPLEDDYDISYLKFDLVLDTFSAYIQGNVTTTATVTAASLTKYVFELSDTMGIDSVKINGILQPVDTRGNICTVVLTAALTRGNVFSAQVFYHGYPRDEKNIFDPGFHNIDGITYSYVEPYFALSWWPCKQSLSDKIDSVDMWVTVPANIKAGSNGILQGVTQLGPNAYRYEWRERYPLDYYLVSVAVGNYTDYSYRMGFTGSTDSMIIMNYVPPAILAAVQPMLDTTALLVDYFSGLFGRYPFWKEKYGHSYTPSFSNMEHQTMTSSRLTHLTVIAHELLHQWFGDNVTCGSWRDIWLNEGFATYGQYLCYDHFNGPDTARSFMNSLHASVLSADRGAVYVGDTVAWPNIFDQRLSYNKGAAVIHMLRYLLNNDTQFYTMLQSYQRQYGGKTATTGNLRQVAETVTGLKLQIFFDQWIYGEGFPNYKVRWNQVGNAVYLQIDQSASWPASVSLFDMPVEVKLYSAHGDTTVRVKVDAASQTFKYTIDRNVDSITIDPGQWLLYKSTGQPIHDAALSKLPATAAVYPNPAHSTLNIAYKYLDNAQLTIYDLAGKKVLSHKLPGTSGTEQVDIHSLSAGVYLYRIVNAGGVLLQGKLVKE